MANTDRKYADLIHDVFTFGERVPSRQGGTTVSANTLFMTFASTPLVMLRRTAWKNALREWEWFMQGTDRVDRLHDKVRHWWNPWGEKHGGRVKYNYGMQFRHAHGWHEANEAFEGRVAKGFDQIEALVTGIREHPYGRRHVLTTWNASDMASKECPITNCHGTVVQFFRSESRLDMTMYQRSCDMILGVPHNWVQYWAFLLWVCGRVDAQPGRFKWIGGDCHIYEEHVDVARRICDAAEVWSPRLPSPVLHHKAPGCEFFRADDFEMRNPVTEPAITDEVRMVV